jgi:glycine dehydrogenase
LTEVPFADRHIGPSRAELTEMAKTVGYPGVAELIDAAVPEAIRTGRPLDLPPAVSETAALARLRELAGRNQVLTSMIGLGYHGTVTPGVILRNVLENPGWYTAYTPYQPEISQGRLEALLNFQTMVSDLTGLPVANASLLDEGTAAAEAMTLAHRVTRGDANVFAVDADVLPQTIEVVRTRAVPLGIEVVVGDVFAGLPDGEVFGVLVQYPGASGAVRDLTDLTAAAHERGAQMVVAADLLALTLLRPPGEYGADIAVGTSQRFGVPYGFGGPHAGYLAVRQGIERQLPGRLVGVSVDADGDPAYRLALQTREQHIRREKATSNICTAQVLLAVMAAMYAVHHGPDGLRAIAERVHSRALALARGLGERVVHKTFFDTVLASVPGRAAAVVRRARHYGINLRQVDADLVAIACDETTTDDHVATVLRAFAEEGVPDGAGEPEDALPRRESAYLTHPVFHAHRSETAMLRYLRKLQDKDIALDRSMIPLGSCTMKLNATAEMEPITWPEFAQIHPYAPLEQAQGYVELIDELESWLAEITGYAKVSVQPNAGSQGELAGLLAVRGYHAARGEAHRNVCLIPASAHGTNAASAVMAGMRVVVVRSDGDIDLDDLRVKVAKHRDELAAIMVTYPSTHGIYEETITEVCELVHEAGGQVYVDGANLNALVGLSRLAEFGADVSHLNLHKTFCIPHGGGGPGVGPVGVREHLAPYLPGHPLRLGVHEGEVPSERSGRPQAARVGSEKPSPGTGPVASAPWGSAGILPISWAYVAMMGADGLRAATEAAVLAANYVAARLAGHYPVLYTGRGGLVAHECIVDLRGITKETKVTAEDVAKRLIDYGLHAPTLAFPVPGTLMIEPTESEDLAELDRFCDAMIEIRAEIERVRAGEYDAEDNPLKNAPHTAASLLTPDWKHAYARESAAYPLASLRRAKYWPPVRRIDQAHGDRNLVCSCPPPEAFEDS